MLHVPVDGVVSGCGQRIPPTARVSAPDPEWFLRGRCYNCFHRLWPQYGPADYIQPHDGKQFPPTRKCPHARNPRYCPRCTPTAAQNWPRPNG
ncbi:hypothetical protein EDD39_6163 [Kitasatospora cineracea]|uniref:Uncharacterized protein n=1 Tax=Kitasatospora cineracea TaxID=88074 RepID=A0A8G1UGR0_9ACTN|nr:hypothetical protein EDD39_6163 [Kitasatospora cineracea]